MTLRPVSATSGFSLQRERMAGLFTVHRCMVRTTNSHRIMDGDRCSLFFFLILDQSGLSREHLGWDGWHPHLLMCDMQALKGYIQREEDNASSINSR
ncbi:hypothetical protein [Reticulibacter mediterranei]|uniref:hypothetical protein n=1 Tax=Reticulibacter mediterranei TaxID=2778369 RepID=UPI001C68AA4D|nr:hypothetical protein [Reticulibacter mediterranei]